MFDFDICEVGVGGDSDVASESPRGGGPDE